MRLYKNELRFFTLEWSAVSACLFLAGTLNLYIGVSHIAIGVPPIGAGGPAAPPPPVFKNLQTGPNSFLKNKRLLDRPLKLVTLLLEKLIIHLFSIYLWLCERT